MIVKNEERNLPRCLDSVRGLAGESIVVDTGSTDATPRIAASYGAQVIPFDFTIVDFAAARNRAIERASGRWILVLDADETLDQASASVIERVVALDENAGYYLERHNRSSDSEERLHRLRRPALPEPAGASVPRPRPRDHRRLDSVRRRAAAQDRHPHRSRVFRGPGSAAPQEPLVHRDSEGRDRRRPERRLAPRFSRRGIPPARDVRRGHRNHRTHRTHEAAATPGRICSRAHITCCTSPIWRGREPILARP